MDSGDKNKSRNKKTVISTSEVSSDYGDKNERMKNIDRKKTTVLSSDAGDVTIIEESQCSDDGDNTTPTKQSSPKSNKAALRTVDNSLDIFEVNGIQANNTLLEKSVKYSSDENKIIDLEAVEINPVDENQGIDAPYYGDNDSRYDLGNMDGGMDVPYHGDNSPVYEGGNMSDRDNISKNDGDYKNDGKSDVQYDGGDTSKYDGGNVLKYEGDNINDDGVDEPYLNDTDMYFMEDGGYNSFVLEMPATDTSLHTSGDKSSSSKFHEKSSSSFVGLVKGSEKSDSFADASMGRTDKDVKSGDLESGDEKTGIDKSGNQNLTSDGSILFDKWPSGLSLPEDADIAGPSSKLAKTPQEKCAMRPQSDFQTPKNPAPCLKQAHPQSDVSADEEWETPQQKPKNKEACMNFRPGIGLHPETNQAITPMPDYAQYPTPDLKVFFDFNSTNFTFSSSSYLVFVTSFCYKMTCSYLYS